MKRVLVALAAMTALGVADESFQVAPIVIEVGQDAAAPETPETPETPAPAPAPGPVQSAPHYTG